MSETAYQVLARKYRPGHFRDLIGQDAMVRTLTNAFAHDRIAHAFILTGVRGVGKTTTARIVAKGLNCLTAGKPTVDPCDTCEACVAISEGRHVDVLEMDAASNTGVDYIREINEAVRYRAASARYKVYIIDEVHMLSTSAFNALLKTLEEPPAHVKFIFATTEIRKVPVTVLSRCQRFDLRRIEPEVMQAHLAGVAEAEGARIAADALALITRAAEGSVRDALSLLDQAIAHNRDAETDAASVREMLGLADRGRVFDLFEAVMQGDAPGALAELGAQYTDGADPAMVLRDLAELTHWLSVLKVSPEAAADPTISPTESARGADLAARLSMRVLTRAWQMLLKSLEELPLAPNAIMAAEMAVIRLTHVSSLPPPEDLVRRLSDASPQAGAPPSPGKPQNGGPRGGSGGGSGGGPGGGATARLVSVSAAEPRPVVAEIDPALAPYATLDDVIARIREARDLKLVDEIEAYVRLVRFRPGLIEFQPAEGTPSELPGRLMRALGELTGSRWGISVSDAPGQPTIAETRRAAEADARAGAAAHPLVAAALALWPGAEIVAVHDRSAIAQPDEVLAAVPDDDDDDADLLDDDPFGEDG